MASIMTQYAIVEPSWPLPGGLALLPSLTGTVGSVWVGRWAPVPSGTVRV